jgi:hypothetical protein
MYCMAKSEKLSCKQCYRTPEAGAIYGLGIIGAAIYYIQHATGFWMGALGILKAFIWPAMLVYKLLGL